MFLEDPVTHQILQINLEKDLTQRQIRKMRVRPDMIVKDAHFVKERYFENTGRIPNITADVKVSLNGRDYFPLIVEGTDLAQVEWTLFSSNRWITEHPDFQKARLAGLVG